MSRPDVVVINPLLVVHRARARECGGRRGQGVLAGHSYNADLAAVPRDQLRTHRIRNRHAPIIVAVRQQRREVAAPINARGVRQAIVKVSRTDARGMHS